MALYMGIDVGGTTVKGIVIDQKGTIICENNVPTPTSEE